MFPSLQMSDELFRRLVPITTTVKNVSVERSIFTSNLNLIMQICKKKLVEFPFKELSGSAIPSMLLPGSGKQGSI